MGVKFLLLYVIYQTVITASWGGVILPFSDGIGKVTPIKPKPLPSSTAPSSVTSSSSLICDNNDNLKLLSPAAKGSISREFSSPLVVTSSSRALPAPKIDSASIENVKMPETLRKKFLAPCKDPVRYTKPNIGSQEVSMTNKHPFLSFASKLPNALPTNSSLETHTLPLLPSITSSSDAPVESLRTSGINFLSSSSKTNQFSSLDGVTLPLSDSIGKVIPIKPKPLPTSTVSSSITSSSSLLCDSKDNLKLFPSAVKEQITQKFSSPIAITSSSRALPVPKINSPSIEDVKIAERLRENFLALRKNSVRNSKPDISSPEALLVNKYPFLSPSSKLPNASPTYSPLEIHKLSLLPSITSLPDAPVESLKPNGIDALSSSTNTNQFSPMGGVTLPFCDSIGKVIPIKPKPLPTSTVSSSITSSSSLICDSKDNPKLFPPAAKGQISREFSSPIAITSSSRALPIPKINSTSIEDVKIPERLREKFSALCKGSVRNFKPDIRSPEVTLVNKYPFLLPPSKLPNASPTYFPLEIHKLSPLPSITLLPDTPVESLKPNGIDFLSSSSKTSQFSPLDGDTLPFCDSIGKVIPIKPKPLPTSTVSSSITSSSSLICDSKENPKLFPPAAKEQICREFSSPIAITSSSRALPVPKINSTSIEDVKIPERLREKFLALRKDFVRNSKPDTSSPEASLANKYPFISPPSELPNALPTYSPIEINKLFTLPSVTSLPDVPVQSLKTSSIDLLNSSSKTSQFSTPISEILLPRSRNCESLSTLGTEKSIFSKQLTANTFSPLSSSHSSPHTLFYKSMDLPGVRSPSEPLSYRPFYYKGTDNFDLPSQLCSHNLLTPPTLSSSNSRNLHNKPCAPYLNSIKSLQIPKPIQLPKTPTNLPISSNSMTSEQNVVIKNPWPSNNVNAASASESELEPLKSVSPSISLRDDQNLLSSIPLRADGSSDFKFKPCNPLKIKPVSLNDYNSPATPLMPISICSPNDNVLSKKVSNSDCSRSVRPETFPITDVCTKTIEKKYPNDLINNQICLNSKNVPKLDIINLPHPSPYQQPSFTNEYFSEPHKYSPPIIPNKPIPTIFSGTSSFSPLVYYPSTISQTPTSYPTTYINQSPTSSVAETTSNMVSSITNMLSNITQNILSSFKSYIHSAQKNIPQTPTFAIASNPYADTLLKPEQALPVLSIPEGNPVNGISLLPVISTPIASDSSTVVSLDSPSALETSPSQLLFISSPKATIPVLSPTSLIAFPSPSLCPSYLPSPILPSYPAMSSPFPMEAPVYQVSSTKKDSDVEKMIELMLVAEILNNDENFDWDDLDSLLAFLSLS